MKLDGIDDIIIINPYKHKGTDIIDLKNNLPIQVSINKTDSQNELIKKTQNNQKLTLSQEELNKIMEEIKHKFSMLEKYLQISIDEKLEIPISKIIDMRTEEVIRQIPPEWIVEILRRIEELRGVFYSKEV